MRTESILKASKIWVNVLCSSTSYFSWGNRNEPWFSVGVPRVILQAIFHVRFLILIQGYITKKLKLNKRHSLYSPVTSCGKLDARGQ